MLIIQTPAMLKLVCADYVLCIHSWVWHQTVSSLWKILLVKKVITVQNWKPRYLQMISFWYNAQASTWYVVTNNPQLYAAELRIS